MRPIVIAGNWKMNLDLGETRTLLNGILQGVASARKESTHVIVCPPFTSLSLASEILRGSAIRLGAQNMSHHDNGAFTGEISWGMLKAVGCRYVIIGHSERRQFYGETDKLISLKMKKALDHDLIPIFCVGETLEQRERGETETVITNQIRGGLEGVSTGEAARMILAYEPVWAIGTGKTATPQQAQDVHKVIRSLLADQFDSTLAASIPIQYGGSVKPENASDLLACDDIDGALVGGACLKAESFLGIVASANR
ncbi:MAG: triose-phosphate isomerase [Ignavibacteria bacterium]|nr:triose-phosphate isomerase [Ignavibacteria bacterium]